MRATPRVGLTVALLTGATLLGLVGCQEARPKIVVDEAKSEKPVSTGMGDERLKAEVLAVLSRADAVDGASDRVVAKCAGCALRMDGSADHALEVGEYHLHFCSDTCRDGFGEKTEQSILALSIPDSAPDPS